MRHINFLHTFYIHTHIIFWKACKSISTLIINDIYLIQHTFVYMKWNFNNISKWIVQWIVSLIRWINHDVLRSIPIEMKKLNRSIGFNWSSWFRAMLESDARRNVKRRNDIFQINYIAIVAVKSNCSLRDWNYTTQQWR